MNNPNEYNLPEGTTIYDVVDDCAKSPAVESRWDVYILRNNEIVCEARIGSSYRGQVIVYLESDEALAAFSSDEVVQKLGKHAPFPFYFNTGWYVFGRYEEDDEERGVGLTIVDKLAFDFGIASSMRYAHIPGFGARSKSE